MRELSNQAGREREEIGLHLRGETDGHARRDEELPLSLQAPGEHPLCLRRPRQRRGRTLVCHQGIVQAHVIVLTIQRDN